MQSGNERAWAISQLANGKNKLMSGFHASVLLLTINFIIDNIIKVAVDPQLLFDNVMME